MPDATSQPAAQPAAAAGFKDPYGAFNFQVDIQGMTVAGFTRCTLPQLQFGVYEYREGGINQVVHKLPGQMKFGDVTLYYGLTASKELWLWLDQWMKGTGIRRNVTIVVLARDGVTPAVRYNLINAWPRAWTGAPLDALTNEAAIEQLTLVYETFERASD